MPESAKDHRAHLVLIILSAVMIKLISLAFIKSAVGGNLLDQLSTKWDAAFYVNIAQTGYHSGNITANYAFAPGYPAFIWLANIVLGNYLLSALVVTNVFSILAVIVFYRVARLYFSSTNSLYASISLTFFPTFVTYGLVSYSEPVYLTFAMLGVYFFLKNRYSYSGMSTAMAVLSGYASLLIPVLFLSILILRRAFPWFRTPGQVPCPDIPGGTKHTVSRFRFAWLAAPLLVFAAWFWFLDVLSGVQYALFVAQQPWGTGLANPLAQFQAFFTGVFSTQGSPVQQLLLRYPYTLAFLALCYPLWKVDKALAFYSAAFMIFVLSLVGTAYASGPRLMLSAWPVLLVFGKSKKEYLLPVLILFVILSLSSTYAQLTSFWT